MSKLQTPDGHSITVPHASVLTAALDDTHTALVHRRVQGSPGDLVESRVRPWWSLDAAGRAMLAEGKPVMWRRASIALHGARIYDAAIFRTRTKADLAEFDDRAAQIAAASPGQNHGAFVIPMLNLIFPTDASVTTVHWPTVAGFVDLMQAHWFPGWRVRRALSGDLPGPDELAWSCRVQAQGGLHDITLIAALD